MIFLDYLFRAILVIDIFLAIASFIFAYILLFQRDRKNPIYFNFGMAVFFLGLWQVVTLLIYLRFLPSSIVSLLHITYLFGVLILHYFTIFTFKFPFESESNKLKIILLYLFTFLISVTIFIPNFYIQEARLDFPFLYEKVNFFGITLFNIYFIFLSVLAIRNLIRKYFNSGGIHRIQLKKIIVGASITIFINLIFSIFVYYFSSMDTSLIGLLSVIAVLFYIYSILFGR